MRRCLRRAALGNRRAARYVLTIEPEHGDAPSPSGVRVLAADTMRVLGRDSASLDVRSAFGTDFTEAFGCPREPTLMALSDRRGERWAPFPGQDFIAPPVDLGWPQGRRHRRAGGGRLADAVLDQASSCGATSRSGVAQSGGVAGRLAR